MIYRIEIDGAALDYVVKALQLFPYREVSQLIGGIETQRRMQDAAATAPEFGQHRQPTACSEEAA